MHRVGLISDTHGLLRPEARAFLEGCDAIVHGGDVGDPRILESLAAIGKLVAVRGNNDRAAWAESLPHSATLEVGAIRIHVVHDLAELGVDPVHEGFQVVVSGHSHQPRIERRDGVLYVNPGSAGPRRFKLPIAVGELRIDGDAVTARIVESGEWKTAPGLYTSQPAVR